MLKQTNAIIISNVLNKKRRRVSPKFAYNDCRYIKCPRYFIKICPISLSQKKSLYRYNENLYILSLHRISFIIDFLFQDFCQYNEMSLYSSVETHLYSINITTYREELLWCSLKPSLSCFYLSTTCRGGMYLFLAVLMIECGIP